MDEEALTSSYLGEAKAPAPDDLLALPEEAES
jgi:hypothetical protein